MPSKVCVFKKCKSDSRRHPWIKWATFVSPKKFDNVERAKKWLQLVGRPDYTIERLKSGSINTFICEDHFPEKDHENLDWKTNPNLTPFPADFDLEAAHNYSEEVVEKSANHPSNPKNYIKKEKKKKILIKRNIKQENVGTNFPMVRKSFFCKPILLFIISFLIKYNFHF